MNPIRKPKVLRSLFAAWACSQAIASAAPSVTGDFSADELAFQSFVASDDLINGVTPTSSSAFFNVNGAHPDQLTDGIHGLDSATQANPIEGAWAQNGATVTYDLGTGDNGFGFDINLIRSIAAWGGLGTQKWTLEVRSSGEELFRPVYTVDYQPAGANATMVVLEDTEGPIATGVVAIRFVALDVAALNTWSIWRELDVEGVPSTAPSDYSNSSTELAFLNDVSNTDLLHGIVATQASGWLNGILGSDLAALNDGVHGDSFDNSGTFDSAYPVPGATATYELGTGTNQTGFDISSIQSIAAWNGGGYGNQAWTVEFRHVNGSWTSLDNVDYQPLGLVAGATKVALNNPAGLLASGVEAIRFTANAVDSAANNAFLWREVDVIGAATPPPGLSDPAELAYENDVMDDDLLDGLTATTASGWINGAGALNDGVHGRTFNDSTPNIEGSFSNTVSVAEFTLGGGANGSGFDIESIQSIAAWNSAAFGNQAWMVEVKPVGGSWTQLDSVDFQPLVAAGATKYTLSDPTGPLATGIEAIRFTTDAAVGTVLREIDVTGTDSPPVVDNTPPALITLSPANGTDRISTQTKLVATFDENIALGTGDIVIVNLDTLAETTITLPDGQVAIDVVDGTKLAVTPTSALLEGVNYAIRIGSTVIEDLAGNAYAGIADNTTWTFTTSYQPLRVLCIGDSITVGYTDNPTWNDDFNFGYRGHLYTSLRDAGYDFQFLGDSPQPWNNFSGDPSKGDTYKPSFDLRDLGQDKHQGGEGATVPQMEAWLSAHDPHLILLMIGINGISEDSPDRIYDLVDTILTDKPDAQLIVAQITPYDGAQIASNQLVYDYNVYIRDSLIPDLVTAGRDVSKVHTVDMYSMFLTNPADYTSAVATGRHSNNFNHPWNATVGGAGYSVMAQQWFDVIETLNLGPDSFRSFMVDPSTGLNESDDLSFDGDPDGDGLASGLEAWLGTNPGIFNLANLSNVSSDGSVTSFEHPQNPNVPSDVNGFYEWSDNLANWYQGDGSDGPVDGATVDVTTDTVGSTTTATATSSEALPKLFLRTGATQD